MQKCQISTNNKLKPKILGYCSSIDISECHKTTGCAYIDGECTHFTGCTAYAKQTNYECQEISELCISDGISCKKALKCEEYNDQFTCQANPSISGTHQCKWDQDQCKDQQCHDAPNSMKSNQQCNQWLKGCISTGNGCTSTLQPCNLYKGNKSQCDTYIGSDGKCTAESPDQEQNCIVRLCINALNTLSSDTECEQYQDGCITNGKGCITSPLPLCSQYNGDVNTCAGYLGQDGPCLGEINKIICRPRKCSDAPVTIKTDQICEIFKSGCLTNGLGCTEALGNCSSFTGSNIECNQYIGLDGYCTNISDQVSTCKVRLCEEAPQTLKSNKDCENYQRGCKTNGKGCTAHLQLCSSYLGTVATCNEFHGSDGNCKGTSEIIEQPCTPKLCSDAPITLTTNEQCDNFQNGCVSTGQGCKNQSTCLNTIGQISCIGTPTCQWFGFCSNDCSQLLTQQSCQGKFIGNQPCFWDKQACRFFKCTDISKDATTDEECQLQLTNCITNGKGCLDKNSNCQEFFGTQSTCESYSTTIKCSNLENATSQSQCQVKSCNLNQKATSDEECQKYLESCKTNGQGCIEDTEPCSSYKGNQSQCSMFTGNKGNQKCWNDLSSNQDSKCRKKECLDIIKVSNPSECSEFSADCIYNGMACTLSSSPCESYYGTQEECNQFQGNNGTNKCWLYSENSKGICKEKECSDALQPKSEDDCLTFMAGCLYNGKGCIKEQSPCTDYFGTQEQCSTYKGTNGTQPCWSTSTNFGSCKERICTDAPSTFTSDSECEQYLSGCLTNGSGCISSDAICSAYNGTQTICKQFVGENGTVKCWNDIAADSNSVCRNKVCNDFNSVMRQSECQTFAATCLYNGSGCTNQSSPCSSYFGTQEQCTAFRGISGTQPCWSTSTNFGSCKERICVDAPSTFTSDSECEKYLSGCLTKGSGCVTSDSACSAYNGTQTICKQFAGVNGTVKCWNDINSDSNSVCRNKVCNDFTSVVSQSECQTFAATCLYNGSGCTDQSSPCSSYFGTQEQCSSYKGSNGTKLCWSTSTSFGSCKEKICTDAPSTFASDTECETYLSGCLTQGSGCIAGDSLCSNYQGTQTICKQFVGSNGTLNCWNDINADSNSVCRNKVCNDFTSVVSHSECQTFAATCLYNGSGCTDQSSPCSSYFGTQEECSTYKGSYGTKLCWSTSISFGSCKERICADAPPTFTSDSECEQYLGGCLTKGLGCISSDAICSAYNGTQTVCKQFVGANGTVKCWNDITADSNSACRNKGCNDFTSVVSQSECQTFAITCLYNGQGCTDQSSSCFAYFGTQEECAAFRGINGTQPCWSTSTSFGSCKERLCADAPSTFTSDSECEQYLGGCLTKGSGCITSDSACSAYNGTQTICKQFVGASGTTKCWNDINSDSNSACRNKICNDFASVVSQSECQAFAATCLYNGSGCTDQSSPCSSYFGTQEQCATFKGINGNQICWSASTSFGSCKERICADAPSTFTSDSECEQYLSGCLTKGSGCVTSDSACSAYNGTQTICKQFVGASGTVKCWNDIAADSNSACRNKICNDFASVVNQSECQAFAATCLYNGSGCTDQSSPCSSYFGTQEQCATFKGINGNQICWSASTSFGSCKERICADAPSTFTSDSECEQYLSGCLTNGSGCISSNSACSTYNGTQTMCKQFVGANGTVKCWNDITADSNSACRNKICNDFASVVNQSECQAFAATCLYNGSGCTDQSSPCSSYFGIQEQCATFKGINGNQICWSASTSFGSCKEKICADAPSTFTSDSECEQYLGGCLTKGSGCITSDSACSAYNGTQIICKQFVGASGTAKCWNDINSDSNSACRNKVCNDLTSVVSQSECQAFAATCLYNGSGCTDQSSPCSSYFGTQEQCVAFKGINGNQICWSTSTSFGSCKEKICADAPSTFTSDSECQQYLGGCLTKGSGCITSDSACSAYKGTQIICQQFVGANGTAKCWNDIAADSNGACRNKICNDFVSVLSQSECQAFATTCLYNGFGCTDQSSPCSSYFGTQEQCATFKGINGTQPCWPILPSSGPCRERTCFHAPITYTTNLECNTFLTDCLTNGQGCLPKSAPCNQYNGSQTQCQQFVGNGRSCYNFNFCQSRNRRCADLAAPTNNQDCSSYMTSCRYSRGICVTASICAFYYGFTLQDCSNVLNSSNQFCWWESGMTCTDRNCNNAPSTVRSSVDCDNHSPGCLYVGNKCQVKGSCNSYLKYGDGSLCNQLTDQSNNLCWNDDASNYCVDRTCQNAPQPISQSNCLNHKSGCIFNSINCINKSNCNVYSVSGTDSERLSICTSLVNLENLGCTWRNGNYCEDNSCSNAIMPISQASCDAHVQNACLFQFSCKTKQCSEAQNKSNFTECNNWKQNCQWNGAQSCMNQVNTCTLVDLSYASALSVKTTVCQGVSLNGSGQKCEYNQTLQTCQNRTCTGNSVATSRAECLAWLEKCQWNGSIGCVDQTQNCEVSVAIGSSNQIKLIFCENLQTTVGNLCTYIDNDINCKEKCQSATGQSNFSGCDQFYKNCQWDGGQSCMMQVNNCSEVILTKAVNNKQEVCQGIQVKSGNKCQLNLTSNVCENRTCTYNKTALNKSSCQDWMTNCQWNGTNGCIEQPQKCSSVNVQSTANPYTYCREIDTTDQFPCAYQPGSLVCVDKCTIANSIWDFSDCESFLSGCQYDGNESCMAQVLNCADVDLSKSTAQNKEYICTEIKLKGSDKKCVYFAYYQMCDDRTCFDNNTATSQQECRNWLEGCNLSRYGQGCTSTTYETCAVPGAFTYSATNKIKICEEMPTQAGFPCTYDEASDYCIDKCLTATSMSTFQSCNQFLNGCQYDGGSSCMVQVSNCVNVVLSKAQSISSKQLVCSNIQLKGSTQKCTYSSASNQCENITCENATMVGSNADCEQWLSGCVWTGGDKCAQKMATCADVDTSGVIGYQYEEFCANIQTLQGYKCQMKNSTVRCEDAPCTKKIDASSQQDCSNWNINCRYNGTSICQDAQQDCSNYIIPNSVSDQASKCYSLTNSLGQQCSQGILSCVNRTCNNVESVANNSDCQSWKSECRYIGGGKCMEYGSCSSYVINGNDNSSRRIICNNIGCAYIDDSSSCQDKTCQNVSPLATSQTDCTNWLNSCRWNTYECINQNNCENYTIPATITTDTQKLTYCLNLTDTSLNLCTYNKLSNQNGCSSRTCDNYTGDPSTDSDCKNYLSSCAITFPTTPKCISINSPCSSFFGTPDQCKNFIGNGKKCSQENNITISSNCVEKQCHHNVSATTNQECESFLIGCKTNGQGCIDASTPCSQIFGSNLPCTSLKDSDNSSYCLSLPCRDKSCPDDQTSVTDQQCQSFLSNCLTKGVGCIDQSEPCSSYYGTQSDCAAFTGNGQKCWSLSITIPTNCVDKQCNHNSTATIDLECEQFLPKDTSSQIPRCVTNGQGCVDYPRTCSQFNGTDSQCTQFTATDGPCKQNILNGSGSCSSVAAGLSKGRRILTEEQTGLQHCQSSTSVDQCQAYGCLWTEMCGDQFNDCASITNFGQGLCERTLVKYGLKRCKWNEIVCQDMRCEDLTGSIYTNHQNCQNVSETCTTTGIGCITMGNCNSYQTQQICLNAKSTEQIQSCVWGEQSCRNQICSDAPKTFNQDYQCDQYLKGCRTSGQGCINSVYQCSELLTQDTCFIDGNEQPCLWIIDQCYSYTQCEDIDFKTHEKCSQISPQCTSDGTKCIPIDKCTNYTSSISCVLGINGVCQWKEKENKCQLAEQCVDIKSSNSQVCQIFSANCISDGVQCIVKSICSTYTNKIACHSGGTDGQCAFTPTISEQNGTCKLMNQCSDANLDYIACSSKQNACYWKEELNITECAPHNCTTKYSNGVCNPYQPNESTLVICVQSDIGCIEGSAQQLNQELCFKNTLGTYSWNSGSGKCEKCQIATEQPRCFLNELNLSLLIIIFMFIY